MGFAGNTEPQYILPTGKHFFDYLIINYVSERVVKNVSTYKHVLVFPFSQLLR